MSEPASAPIVFAVDFSEMTDYVIHAAIAQAELRTAPELHAIVVLEASGNPLHELQAQRSDELAVLEQTLEARISEAFERAGHPLDAPASWEIETHARVGNASTEIAELARELRADLIVVGRHGHAGPRDWILGTVPSRVVQLARCGVLIVQPSDYRDDYLADESDLAIEAAP